MKRKITNGAVAAAVDRLHRKERPSRAGVGNWMSALWLACILCMVPMVSAVGQCTAENKAFKSGEHVMYDLYFNWKFIKSSKDFWSLWKITLLYKL